MRQVPCNYLVIGNGRLAKHICYYFDLLRIPYQQWFRQSPISLDSIIAPSTHVLLIISDSAIDSFIEQHSALLGTKNIVHFSGCHVSARAWSAHPLMTFPETLYTSEFYPTIPFIIEQEGPTFTELLPGLPNPHGAISQNNKAYYHSLCVMANNFTTILWQKLFGDFETKFSLPAVIAMPMLQKTAANLTQDYTTALTGPLKRGDTRTLEKNILALKSANDPFEHIFTAFSQLYNADKNEHS